MVATAATAVSLDGTIAVRTTDGGVPLRIRIAASELRQDPRELARKVHSLCLQSAGRAGLARRQELAAAGVDNEVLTLLGLPTAEQVARREMAEEQAYGIEEKAWVHRQ